MSGEVVIVGGTSGLGLAIAQTFAGRGDEVVVTSRDSARAESAAGEIGGKTRGVALDLADPGKISGSLTDVGTVKHLVLGAIERDMNTVSEYDMEPATRLVTLKLIGYTEVVHALRERLAPDASIVIFGGVAKDRPYPGSTTVTTVNAAMSGLVRTMAVELAPIRVNGIHPGIVGDTPAWAGRPPEVLEAIRTRTPTGRLATTEDVVNATVFLLENPSVNGTDLQVDGGWLLL